jgi:uncharacterized protein (DUF1697 family)
MIRHVAFLRGINVAGQKLIKMEELARIFASMGLRNVRTYIQCGNVIFDHASGNSVRLRKKIERTLQDVLGYEVPVILRPLADIEAIVERNPFRKIKADDDVMLCVVFLSAEPPSKPKLPLISATEKLEVFEVRDRAAFIVARRKKSGWFGFPNNFVEKELGVLATTRQVTTVRKIVDFANANAKSQGDIKKKTNSTSP